MASDSRARVSGLGLAPRCRLARYSGSCQRLRRLAEILARDSAEKLKLALPNGKPATTSRGGFCEGRGAAGGRGGASRAAEEARPSACSAAVSRRRARRSRLKISAAASSACRTGSCCRSSSSALSRRASSASLLRAAAALVPAAIARRVASLCRLPAFQGTRPLFADALFSRDTSECRRPSCSRAAAAAARGCSPRGGAHKS